MPVPDLLQIFVRPIHDASLRYLVAGSLGSMFFSEPRLTLDIDLALAVSSSSLKQLAALFPQPDFYAPPAEILVVENERECRGHFNVIHVATGMKADFYPSQRDPFFAWAWGQRRCANYSHGDIFFAPPEYVIVWKVAYFHEGGGEKHVRDIQKMFETSGSDIDESLLEDELAKRGLLDPYRRLRAA